MLQHWKPRRPSESEGDALQQLLFLDSSIPGAQSLIKCADADIKWCMCVCVCVCRRFPRRTHFKGFVTTQTPRASTTHKGLLGR